VPLPVAASAGVEESIAILFAVLLAAKIGDEVFRRIHQPAVIGEILAGVVLGGYVLGVVDSDDEVLEVFAELGVIFLLFWVGLEVTISDLREVGRPAIGAGLLGVVLPFAGGLVTGLVLGFDVDEAVFMGAALVATSVAITSTVLTDLGVVRTRAGRTIIGAGVVDDICAILLLGLAVGVAGGDASAAELAATAALAVAFVAFIALGGTRLLRADPGLLARPRFSESPLLPAVILCLGLAALAASIGLAAIVGAFLAGMIVAETKETTPVHEEVAPLYAFFPPFFLVFIGVQVELDELASGETLLLLAALTAVAAATKFVGAYLGAASLGRREAAIVGVGMVPRGEVGIIVAGLGLSLGAIDEQLFAVVVGMSLLTTLVAPYGLRALIARSPASSPSGRP
jgi:Kef-type K+ transport system membrane component KefB